MPFFPFFFFLSDFLSVYMQFKLCYSIEGNQCLSNSIMSSTVMACALNSPNVTMIDADSRAIQCFLKHQIILALDREIHPKKR